MFKLNIFKCSYFSFPTLGFASLISWNLQAASMCTEAEWCQLIERGWVRSKCGMKWTVCFFPQSADSTCKPILQHHEQNL